MLKCQNIVPINNSQPYPSAIVQGLLEDYDDIVVAAGSVGTTCGLAAAKHLTGAAIKIHAVATHNTEEFIYGHVDQQLRALGIQDAQAKTLIDPIMDYVEYGYGRSTDKELGLYLFLSVT